jgi:tetratricopeptide (TPR) repeat protein
MGLRRGRSRLTALGVALLFSTGCFGLSEDDELRHSFFRENSLGAYDRGEYVRALHQANMALSLEEDDTPMQLIKGFCLLKLGKATGNGPMVEESLSIFKELEDSGDGDDDFRVYLGLGSAHVARALQYDREMPPVERRLGSEFLSKEGRVAEQKRLDSMRAKRLDHLKRAERDLRTVLAFELQKDNLFATVDLVVALNSLGGRDIEAMALSEKALALLDESNRFTRNSLDRNTRLSASARINLQRQLEGNREKEMLLRDIIATIAYNLGDMDGFLTQLAQMERRDMIGEVQLFNRAAVYEQTGDYEAAATDLEAFLRLRVRRMEYEQDQLAPEIFQRIEDLRARHAEQARR